MSIQDVMKEIMAREGLSQHALSAMLNIPRTTLESAICSKKGVRVKTAEIILEAMGAEIAIGSNSIKGTTEMEVIKSIMMDKDLTHSEVARRCGRSRTAITSNLNDGATIRMSVLLDLAHALEERVYVRYDGREWEL